MDNKKISLYVVEDYLLTRITYRHSLPRYNENLEIVNDFETAESCIAALKENEVDVILMDLGLPGMNGIDATQIIKSKYPKIKIIILTSHDSDNEVLASLTSGANAYALKDISPENLTHVIESVNRGALWLDPRIAQIAIDVLRRADNLNLNDENTYDFNLTMREKEVLGLIIKGKTNTEIAKEIIVSPNTVKAHVGNILEKLAVSDRVQAAVKAIECNLVENR